MNYIALVGVFAVMSVVAATVLLFRQMQLRL